MRLPIKKRLLLAMKKWKKRLKNIAVQNRMDPVRYRDMLVSQKKLDSLRYQLRDDKVLNFLLEKANIGTRFGKRRNKHGINTKWLWNKSTRGRTGV